MGTDSHACDATLTAIHLLFNDICLAVLLITRFIEYGVGMTRHYRSSFPAMAVLTTLLAACGGGGGDGDADAGPTASVLSFPLQAGYRARIAAGSIDNFSVSGTCKGSATVTNGAATASNFEGVTGYAAPETATVNLTNCTPATISLSGTNYYDEAYSPLGSSIPGVEYSKYEFLPSAIPASVRVGDAANYLTFDTYTDSSKSVRTGQEVLSYVIEAETSTTAIANLSVRSFDTSNRLLFTEQSRYRIAADGTLTFLSVDGVDTASGDRLILTRR